VRDHRLEHVARLRLAGEEFEHAATDRTNAIVDGQLLGFRQALGLDLLQVGRQHERLEATAAEQRRVGLVRYAPGIARRIDIDLRALRSGQCEKAIEQAGNATVAASRTAVARRGQRRHSRGGCRSGKQRCRGQEMAPSHAASAELARALEGNRHRPVTVVACHSLD
jgi:hypothetical protein